VDTQRSCVINGKEILNEVRAGDLITVAVTSSAAADQPPQLLKTTINLR